REAMYRFSVRRGADIRGRVVPFFESHPLRTAKADEFQRFVRVLQLMEAGRHLEHEGMGEIARIAETMNHRKRARYLESSEAIRQPSAIDVADEDMVQAAWRHAEYLSEI